ncbi:MPND protein, partial [Leiothrix lutea]|nr:MPND protein [Leiothrix lutea]
KAAGGARGAVLTRRGITLRVLLRDGLLEPGRGVLSIYYLGKKFVGDLGSDGTITWQETGQVFNSPSAWATHCKRLVNPAKKSGCGWASVRYKGQKLDQYKAAWLRQHQPNVPPPEEVGPGWPLPGTPGPGGEVGASPVCPQSLASEGEEEELPEEEEEEAAREDGLSAQAAGQRQRLPALPGAHLRYVPGVSPRAGAAVTPPCHPLCGSSQHTSGLPCVRCRDDPRNEAGRQQAKGKLLPPLYSLNLTPSIHFYTRPEIGCTGCHLLTWMVKHPRPFYHGNPGVESKITPFWVMPPPEQRPNDYGIPMDVEVTYIQDGFLTNDVVQEMTLLVEFYKGAPDLVKFQELWSQDQTYLDKLKVGRAGR